FQKSNMIPIKPKVLGGEATLDNLITVCPTHNYLVGAKDLSNYLADSISRNSKFYNTFLENLGNIEKLLEIDANSSIKTTLNKLLFANTITAMETYLSDAFINTVTHNNDLMKKFVESTPYFCEKKYKLSDLFKWQENLKKEVTNYLLEIIYHNVFVVKNMYKCVLDIDFPEDMELLQKAIMLRHDIVHRNGKTKTGKVIVANDENVKSNLTLIREFIDNIDQQLQSKYNSKKKRENL
ncbi:HNH endonuclease signature motif containing protein, partial [Nostoc cycadae]|uniref:HNH endonuclease signature motif containing protein n=1 Tax=Nostoc cycadae TaxID=246795 RepID=UPI001C9D8BA2